MRLKYLLLGVVCFCFISCSQTSTEQTIELTIKDHKFLPSEIKAKANTKIRLVVENLDNEIEEFESFDLKREKLVLPLSKTIIVIAPLKKGTYYFFGDFHQDTAKGNLIVE